MKFFRTQNYLIKFSNHYYKILERKKTKPALKCFANLLNNNLVFSIILRPLFSNIVF